MRQRRKYSAEFKLEAVQMVRNIDVSTSQVAGELGINATMLGRWRREQKAASGKAFQGPGKTRDEDSPRRNLSLTRRLRKHVDFFNTIS